MYSVSSVRQAPQLSILLLLISFPAVMATIFAPALPVIAIEFKLSIPMTQMLVTVYLIGATIGQLIYGPLSNYFGRKPAIYFGIVIAMIGISMTIFASLTYYYELLLIGRLLTALGACAGMVMNFILIRDSFDNDKARQVISYTLMLSAIVPGISATIGGFLVEVFNWKNILHFLLAYSASLVLVCLYLPETCVSYDKQALNLSNVIRGYMQQLSQFKLILGALMMGGNTVIIYIFSATSPFIVIQYMEQSPELYGLLMLIPSIGLLLGSMLSASLVNIFRTTYAITLGLGFILISTLFMLITFELFSPSLWSLFTSMFFMYLGIAISYSNTSVLTLGFTSNSSNGSAVIAFINSAVSMIGVFTIQILQLTKVKLLPIIFLFIIVIMILIYLLITISLRKQVTFNKT